MSSWLLLSVCLMLRGSAAVTVPSCGYQSCPKFEKEFLNVHIVPHTHDDVGWLKTVDQYYYGSRNDIQKAGVQYILDSVIEELWADPSRRFIYVETAFFWKWWERQPDKIQKKVHKLVSSGQLQFVGGAWSMNDEATTHYQSTVDQFTWGLRKLNDTFGACGLPTVGWQIDPFGHSREFASLLAAMGYHGLFLGRIDYEDKDRRLFNRSMEMLWRGDDDLGSSSDIFTGVLFNTYSPPPGFCFDVLCQDEPIVDEINSPMYNVEHRVSQFMSFLSYQRKYFTTGNIILTMGGDFTYQHAGMWYSNLDKLIRYANLQAAEEDMKIKLYYSTPNCYLHAIKLSEPNLAVKQDDFFPYASDPTAYWTGYFTSRPSIKFFEREGNAYLQMAKQLQVLGGLDEKNIFILNELRSVMGVMQHHDAVTGTEKQHVTKDYERMLHTAIEDSLVIHNEYMTKLTGDSGGLSYERCQLNVSQCFVSETSDTFVVSLYNPLGWKLEVTPVRIPVTDGQYVVTAPNGDKIETQLVPLPKALDLIPTRKSSSTHELVFLAYNVKPMGYKNFYVERKSAYSQKQSNHIEINSHESDAEFLKSLNALKMKGLKPGEEIDRYTLDAPKTNGHSVFVKGEEETLLGFKHLKIRVNNTTEQISHLIINGENMPFDIKFAYYPGCVGNNSSPEFRSSGAYIFRPNATTTYDLPNSNSLINIIPGDIVTEYQYKINEYITYVARIYNDSKLNFVENQWYVGPIPINDATGKEIVIKYSSDIENRQTFYTDSNGRQILRRKLNSRYDYNVTLTEPIASNYYPVVNEIYIEDAKRMSVVTDRAQGGTSLQDGEIELMVHRRLLHDDAFGVGEALNEISLSKGLIISGAHRIFVSKFKEDLIDVKRNVLEKHLQPITLFSEAKSLTVNDWLKLKNCVGGVVKDYLPEGVHVLTLEPWKDKLLLRLENYYNKVDHVKTDVKVDLTKLFMKMKIKGLRETNLSANQWLEDVDIWRWTSGDFVDDVNKVFDGEAKVATEADDGDAEIDGFTVTLRAKQIRTFIVDYELEP